MTGSTGETGKYGKRRERGKRQRKLTSTTVYKYVSKALLVSADALNIFRWCKIIITRINTAAEKNPRGNTGIVVILLKRRNHKHCSFFCLYPFKVLLTYLTKRSCLSPCYETSSIYPATYRQQTVLKLQGNKRRDWDFPGCKDNMRRPAVQNIVREN